MPSPFIVKYGLERSVCKEAPDGRDDWVPERFFFASNTNVNFP